MNRFNSLPLFFVASIMLVLLASTSSFADRRAQDGAVQRELLVAAAKKDRKPKFIRSYTAKLVFVRSYQQRYSFADFKDQKGKIFSFYVDPNLSRKFVKGHCYMLKIEVWKHYLHEDKRWHATDTITAYKAAGNCRIR